MLTQRDFSFLADLTRIFEKKSNSQQNPFIQPLIQFQPESPSFLLVQRNSLIASSPPLLVTPQVLGAIFGEPEPETRKEIIEYPVQVGDNLSSIANQFEISLATLLAANDLKENSLIKPGQELIILPVSGVLHHVKSGDTLSGIAQRYQGKISEIIAFNGLSDEGDIFVGDILIIPNGQLPPSPSISPPSLTPLAKSYFICPISSPCKVTQGLHWYNAVDFSHGQCAEPVYAAAGGEVQRVKFGWNWGAGNYLTILHLNGVVTMYGHLQSILVKPGQPVSQGQIIALVGGQPGTSGAGRSTGCHLHFGVQGAKNPFAR